MKSLVKVSFWCRTNRDREDDASDAGSITVPQAHAARIAREIDATGSYRPTPKADPVQAKNQFGNPAATFHGTVADYPSGRVLTFSGHDTPGED